MQQCVVELAPRRVTAATVLAAPCSTSRGTTAALRGGSRRFTADQGGPSGARSQA